MEESEEDRRASGSGASPSDASGSSATPSNQRDPAGKRGKKRAAQSGAHHSESKTRRKPTFKTPEEILSEKVMQLKVSYKDNMDLESAKGMLERLAGIFRSELAGDDVPPDCYDLMTKFLLHENLEVHSFAVSQCLNIKTFPQSFTESLIDTAAVIGDSRRLITLRTLISRGVYVHKNVGVDKVVKRVRNSLNDPTTESESFMASFHHILDATLYGVMKHKEFSDLLSDLLDHALKFVSEKNVVYSYCFSAMALHLKGNSEALARVSDKLFSLFTSEQVQPSRLPICRTLVQLAYESPSCLLEPLSKFRLAAVTQALTDAEHDALRRATIATLSGAGIEKQVEMVDDELQPVEERLHSLVDGATSLDDLISGGDFILKSFVPYKEILGVKLERKQHPMAEQFRRLLPRLVKLLRLLNSVQDSANARTQEEKLIMSELRTQCYVILELACIRLDFSIFFTPDSASASGGLTESLGEVLTSELASLDKRHFSHLLRTVDHFVKICSRRHFNACLRGLVLPFVSTLQASLTLVELQMVTPSVLALLHTLMSFEALPPDIIHSDFSGIVLALTEFCKKAMDEAAGTRDPKLTKIFIDVVNQDSAAVTKLRLTKSVQDKVLDFLLLIIGKLWQVSKKAFQSLPGMRECELEAFKKVFSRERLETLLLNAKNLAATKVQLETLKELIIECNGEAGYVVTQARFSEEQVLDYPKWMEGEIKIQKLYLSTSPKLVQSEVLLEKKHGFLAEWLLPGYLRALAALMFPVPLVKRRVLVIGFGAGVLSEFVRLVFEVQVTGVEINPAVARIAEEHFGIDTNEIELQVCDGLQFVKNPEIGAGEFDAIIVDVVGEPRHAPDGLYAPPKMFLKDEFLSDCKRILHSTGALILNTIIPPDDTFSAHEYVQEILTKAFGEEVFNIMMDRNVCFIAFVSEQDDPKAGGLAALKMKIEEGDYYIDCLDSGIRECSEQMDKRRFDDETRMLSAT